jgi:hypothetical protein
MIFRSADRALRFAYSLADRPICKTSGLGTWRGKERSGDELTHAQAMMIQNCVDRLQDLERSYIDAHYSHGGQPQWDGRLRVAQWLHGEMGEISFAAHKLMLEQYIEGRGGLRKLRAEMRVDMRKVGGIRREVFARLDSLHNRAIVQLEEYFIEKDLLGSAR